MKIFRAMEDWLLYWGSKDERVRTGADKSGHVAMYIFMVEYLALVMFLAFGPEIPRLQLLQFVAWGGMIPLIVYSVLWVRKGLTFTDTAQQKKAVTGVIVFCPFLFAGLGWLSLSGVKELAEHLLWLIPAYALGGTLLVGVGYWVMNLMARNRLKKELEEVSGEF